MRIWRDEDRRWMGGDGWEGMGEGDGWDGWLGGMVGGDGWEGMDGSAVEENHGRESAT
jgi:hypothetical protein